MGTQPLPLCKRFISSTLFPPLSLSFYLWFTLSSCTSTPLGLSRFLYVSLYASAHNYNISFYSALILSLYLSLCSSTEDGLFMLSICLCMPLHITPLSLLIFLSFYLSISLHGLQHNMVFHALYMSLCTPLSIILYLFFPIPMSLYFSFKFKAAFILVSLCMLSLLFLFRPVHIYVHLPTKRSAAHKGS